MGIRSSSTAISVLVCSIIFMYFSIEVCIKFFPMNCRLLSTYSFLWKKIIKSIDYGTIEMDCCFDKLKCSNFVWIVVFLFLFFVKINWTLDDRMFEFWKEKFKTFSYLSIQNYIDTTSSTHNTVRKWWRFLISSVELIRTIILNSSDNRWGKRRRRKCKQSASVVFLTGTHLWITTEVILRWY